MEKGDMVMADHPDSRSKNFVRSYGIVQEITQTGRVIIKMADGSLISRRYNSIAVYVQPPPNWQELFEQQVVFSPEKQQMMIRSSSARRRQN
jgi:hypothetical protein